MSGLRRVWRISRLRRMPRLGRMWGMLRRVRGLCRVCWLRRLHNLCRMRNVLGGTSASATTTACNVCLSTATAEQAAVATPESAT